MTREETIYELGEWLEQMIQHGVPSHSAKRKALATAIALLSAEAEQTVIRSRTLMPTKDFKEWAKRVRETNPNVIVIPCDAEVVSADAVHSEWEKTTDGNGWNEWYVLKCPLCDATIEDRQNRKWEYNFCPNCGAKMKGGAE